jgi:hypothetical protein
MFQFAGFPHSCPCRMCQRITAGGFPHSDTPGSLSAFDSPGLFADCCVLLRLQVPRHPPYALFNLIIVFIQFFCKNCFFLLLLETAFSGSFLRSAQLLSFLDYSKRQYLSVIRFSKNYPLLKNHSSGTRQKFIRLSGFSFFLRKEVIHPHVLVGIPCYDLTPIISPAFDGSLLQQVGPPASGIANSHGLTGGVYKTRERIHRGMLIRDY